MNAGLAGPLLQPVPVQLRHHMLIPLGGHNRPGFLHIKLLCIVALVHRQAQGLVLSHGKCLLKVPHLFGLTKAAALSQIPGPVVVLQRLRLQAEHVDRPRSGKLQIQIVVHRALGVAPLAEAVQHGLPVFFSKVHGIHFVTSCHL